MSIKINKDNYELYKKVYGIISQHLYKDIQKLLPAETNPIVVLDNWEKTSQTKARKGLQAGLNDILTSLKYAPDKLINDINTDLENQHLPNTKQLLNIINKTVIKVLTDRKIKNQDQYYIIKELLDDTNSEISIQDRKTLSTHLLTYEKKQRPANNKQPQ